MPPGARQVVVAAPPREEDAVGADLVGDGDRVLALPLARAPAPHHEGRRMLEAGAGPGERRISSGIRFAPMNRPT